MWTRGQQLYKRSFNKGNREGNFGNKKVNEFKYFSYYIESIFFAKNDQGNDLWPVFSETWSKHSGLQFCKRTF